MTLHRDLAMWADAMLTMACHPLARWTVVVIDRFDGQEYPVRSVRFRWYTSVDWWLANYRLSDTDVRMEVRAL